MNAKSKSLKVFSWISIFFSLGIILIGISVIFNWYKYDETIFQTMPKAVPMPFISAIILKLHFKILWICCNH